MKNDNPEDTSEGRVEEEIEEETFDAKKFVKKQCEEKALDSDKSRCEEECGKKPTEEEIKSCADGYTLGE